jgi:two-component system chemotaxis response regulator CheY
LISTICSLVSAGITARHRLLDGFCDRSSATARKNMDRDPWADATNPPPVATRVLLVEDEADIREMLAVALQMAGFTVHEASNGTSALTCMRRERIDVIVTDLSLPDLQGMQIVRALRRESHPVYIPIIVLTGRLTEAIEDRARVAGANLFLQKPCDSDELLLAMTLF